MIGGYKITNYPDVARQLKLKGCRLPKTGEKSTVTMHVLCHDGLHKVEAIREVTGNYVKTKEGWKRASE